MQNLNEIKERLIAVAIDNGCEIVDSVFDHTNILINALVSDKGEIEPLPTPLQIGILGDQASYTLTPEIHTILRLRDFEYDYALATNRITRLLCISTLARNSGDHSDSGYYVLSVFYFDEANLNLLSMPTLVFQSGGSIPTNMPFFNPQILNRGDIVAFIAPSNILIFIDEPQTAIITQGASPYISVQDVVYTKPSFIWYAAINDSAYNVVIDTPQKLLWGSSNALLQIYSTSGTLVSTTITKGLIKDTNNITPTDSSGRILYRRFLSPDSASVASSSNITLATIQNGYTFYYDGDQNVLFCSELNNPTAILWVPGQMPVYKQTQNSSIVTAVSTGTPWTFIPDSPLIDLMRSGNGLRFVTADGVSYYNIVPYTVVVTPPGQTQSIEITVPSLEKASEGDIKMRISNAGAIKDIDNVTYIASNDNKLFRIERYKKDKSMMELTDGKLPAYQYFDSNNITNSYGATKKFPAVRNILPVRIKDNECLIIGSLLANLHRVDQDGTVSFSALVPTSLDRLEWKCLAPSNEVNLSFTQYSWQCPLPGADPYDQCNVPKRITASEEISKGHFIALREKLFYMPYQYDWSVAESMYYDPFGAVLIGVDLGVFDTFGGAPGILHKVTVVLEDLYQSANNIPYPNSTNYIDISMAVVADGRGNIKEFIDNLYNDDYWSDSVRSVDDKYCLQQRRYIMQNSAGAYIRKFNANRANKIFSVTFDFYGIRAIQAHGYLRYHTTTGFPPVNSEEMPPYNQYLQKYKILGIFAEVQAAVAPTNIETPIIEQQNGNNE